MAPDNKINDKNGLDSYRQEIDGIDSQIISLLTKRQEIATSVGQIKKARGLEIFDPAREEEIMRRLAGEGKGLLSKEAIRHIYSEIISASRAVQESLTVAYFGPEATFTHQAAISLFGRSASMRAAETIEEVFGLVEKGVCRQGVVPVENSYEGSVNRTLDMLHRYELKICAEILLRIRHHLLSKAEDIKDVKTLYSHPMPIAQCRAWMRSNLSKTVTVKEVGSTSLAAKLAAEDPASAAVGSALAAKTYNLKTLQENIEDHPDNVTRFLSIGKASCEPTGKDKCSILFFLSHKPGSLYNALGILAKNNINMTRIESRPMKIRNWEYLFLVDIEGHEKNINVHEAILEMEKTCPFVKRLGSYPAAGEPWE
ncbi:P-protein (Includes: Chorismate mutase; Prephenate dehydratase) [uncultured Desulfobacterium sp.]|uniref:Bifunctional chorismate mutase/prephenate dehydratase n=1 Tax=uncultured Desulfobacterium sp. TaxID=201089 RepID=A0A445MRT1_9BACT|nr:P-protein (Includes: Chorismate mutase; Prephenate dehydratase) [uncultured Desulfobacterium sp.]